MRVVVIFLLCWSTMSWAKQYAWNVDKDTEFWTFNIRWGDQDNQKTNTTFLLPTQAVLNDLKQPLKLSVLELAKHERDTVNQWGKRNPSVVIRATVGAGGTVRVSAQGSDRNEMQQALKQSDAIRQQARQEFLSSVGYKEYPN